jgi:hypothetical protein
VLPVSEVQHGMPQARGYYQLGRYLHGQNRLAEAERAYRKALEADPDYIDALNGLGAIQACRGELEQALVLFERVAKLAPAAAQSHNNLGYALYMKGRFTEAREHLRRAVELERGNAYAKANLALVAAAMTEGQTSPQPVENADASAPARVEALPPAFAAEQLLSPLAAAQVLSPELAVLPPLAAASRSRDEPQTEATVTGSRTAQLALAGDGRGDGSRRSSLTVSFPTSGEVHSLASAGGTCRTALRGACPAPFRLEVSNGNGTRGLASRLAARLTQSGQPVARVTNNPRFDVTATRIEYRSGFADSARDVNMRFTLGAQAVETRVTRPGTDVRLILGRDASGALQRLADGTSPSMDPAIVSAH